MRKVFDRFVTNGLVLKNKDEEKDSKNLSSKFVPFTKNKLIRMMLFISD